MDDLPTGALRPLRNSRHGALGLSRRELSGSLWRAPFRGIRTWAGLDPCDPLVRVREAALLVPDGAALGGWAAAYVHGAAELDGIGRHGQPEPVLVCLKRQQQLARGAAVVPFRSPPLPDEVVEVGGVAVTAPLRTCFDLGRLATSLEEAVVTLDCALRDLGVTVDDLDSYARERLRWKGVPRLLRALPLVDVRSASRGESRYRLVWVLEAGLPRPEVNVEVFDEDGWLIGIGDLVIDRPGMVGEYDGAQHRESRAHADDNAREEDLERTGLVVTRATSLDVGPRRPALVRRLRRAWDDARRPRPRRWAIGRHQLPRRAA